jgi:8-oxo-dGTP diphosphatase
MQVTAAAELQIAAAILIGSEGRMLLVRKAGSDWFMQPGGKIEPGETSMQALARELDEEIAVELADPEPEGVFSAPAANEPETRVVAHMFSGRIDAEPTIGGEIAELLWLDPAAPGDMPLAPLSRDLLPLAIDIIRDSAGELR